jgi:hypothetical protein
MTIKEFIRRLEEEPNFYNSLPQELRTLLEEGMAEEKDNALKP